MGTRAAEREYEGLSPFELKNKLLAMASTPAERMMLNAGRGNPNWVALAPREAFFILGRFALAESERTTIRPGFGGPPQALGCAARLVEFLGGQPASPGRDLLQQAPGFVGEALSIDGDAFIHEFVDGILGDHYPVPDRMLAAAERIVDVYLAREMCGGAWPDGPLDLFATEGGTAAMAYVFNSLMENHLLAKGDAIALGTPIFTPYLEIPCLNDFELHEIDAEQSEDQAWRYPPAQIEKLADPAVKAFFVVHPSNPSSRAMHPETLDAIGELVRTRRRDLIILTDDVYGTFVNGFRSLAAVAPRNTILVYSFSKYFGATGWRLGVIGLHPDSALDRMIAALPAGVTAQLHERYRRVFVDPASTKLIDRMVADSRTVSLHHTAGLSTPQQVMMTLFALACLLDGAGVYKKSAQEIVAHRWMLLYEALGIEAPDIPLGAHYYTIIDVPKLAAARYGSAFAEALVRDHQPIDFVWRLARDKGVVLMDGGGFDAPRMSVRVSLANLSDDAYPAIGRAISELLEAYHARWKGG